MPEPLDIPDDLRELYLRRHAAERQLADYVHTVETRRREQYPDPEQVVERRRWTDDELAEDQRLRAEYDALVRAVRAHPTIVQAHATGCWPPTWQALQDTCRTAA